MPTIERPATRNTMAKSASVGTARRTISWIVRLAALPAVAIGGVDAIRWSMSYLTFDFDVHVCTCKRNALRLLIYVHHSVPTGRITTRGLDARAHRRN